MGYTDVVLADSPLHYYDMANLPGALQIDRGSAPMAATGPAQNIAGFSGPSSDTGSVFLDGSQGFLVTPRNGPHLPAPGTLELWFWVAGQTTAASGYMFNTNCLNGTNYLVVDANAGFFQWSLGAYFNNTMMALDFNKWHQFVLLVGSIVAGNANSTLYVDGALKDGPHNGALAVANGVLSMGQKISNLQRSNGLLGPVSSYPTVLSAARILDHYNAADRKGSLVTYQGSAGFGGPTPNLSTMNADLSTVLSAVRKTYPTT